MKECFVKVLGVRKKKKQTREEWIILIERKSVDMIFMYRKETIKMLEWKNVLLRRHSYTWQTNHYNFGPPLTLMQVFIRLGIDNWRMSTYGISCQTTSDCPLRLARSKRDGPRCLLIRSKTCISWRKIE